MSMKRRFPVLFPHARELQISSNITAPGSTTTWRHHERTAARPRGRTLRPARVHHEVPYLIRRRHAGLDVHLLAEPEAYKPSTSAAVSSQYESCLARDDGGQASRSLPRTFEGARTPSSLENEISPPTSRSARKPIPNSHPTSRTLSNAPFEWRQAGAEHHRQAADFLCIAQPRRPKANSRHESRRQTRRSRLVAR